MFSKRRDPQPSSSSGQRGAKPGQPPATPPNAAGAPPEQPYAQAQAAARTESDEMRDMWSAMAALLDNTTVRADGSSADASAPPASPAGSAPDEAAPYGAHAEAARYNDSPAPDAAGMTEEPPGGPAGPFIPAPPAAPHSQPAAAPARGSEPSPWAPPSLLPPGSAPVRPVAPVSRDAPPPATAPAPEGSHEQPGAGGQPGASGVGPQLFPAFDDTLFTSPPSAQYAAQYVAPYAASGAPSAFVLREPGSPFTMPPQLDQNAVTLRGRSDGIAVEIASGKWEDLLQLLSYRLEQTDGFFSGGYVTVDVGTRQMNEAELDLLARVLGSYSMQAGLVRTSAERTFQAALALGIPCAQVGLDGTVVNEAMPALAEDNTYPFFVYRGSLRSGQQIFRPEHIMIMGDVNPGAEVASSGDILIWGRLRGIAHAGAQGNTGAIIAALDLDPVQLRIDTVVAAAQAGQSESGGPRWGAARAAERRPEIARLVSGRLLIEAWDDVKTAGAPLLKRRRA